MSDHVLTPAKYPNLDAQGYSEESEATRDYNCIAWALNRSDNWWWPHPDGSWPDGCPMEETIGAFEAMFTSLGYELCTSDDRENGTIKIALYANGDTPTHAARQLPNGKWTSKIGRHIDISHTLLGLEGPRYGSVVKIYRNAQS